MLINHFIDYLKSDVEISVAEKLEGSTAILIPDLVITANKDFRFQFSQTLRFENCTFLNLKIESYLNLEFVNCKFLSVYSKWGTTHFMNVTADTIAVRDDCRSILSGCNRTVGLFSITSSGGGAVVSIVNCNLPNLRLYGGYRNSNIDVDACIIDELYFNGIGVEKTAKLMFHNVTVNEQLVFENSILDYTEFHSCNFKNAIHVITNSRYDNTLFINIEWFEKIYTRRNRRKRFYDKYVRKKIVPRFKRTKFLGIDKRIQFFFRREFYEAYREYKLNMSRVQNRPDEIYFKAKEYNAKFWQMSWSRKNIGDKLILILNGISNNHGEKWLRPIFLIFLFGYIFFYLFITNSSLACNAPSGSSLVFENYSAYLRFLNPTHDLYLLDGHKQVELKDIAVVWDLIFRVISSYLIVQTVMAFRKYKE